jgi:hypothetical protein
MTSEQTVRQHLIRLLREPQAHLTFTQAVADFPIDQAGIRPEGCPHSAWELVEHIRIAQEDILHFSGALETTPRLGGSRENPEGYVPRKWPDDYWPASPAPAGKSEWQEAVAAVERDTAAFVRLLEDSERDLFTPFPWGEGQTLLREAMLIADHTSYHTGQIVLVRRLLTGETGSPRHP